MVTTPELERKDYTECGKNGCVCLAFLTRKNKAASPDLSATRMAEGESKAFLRK
jgi:hypothetical protein